MTEEAVNVMNNFRQNTNFNRTQIMDLLGKVLEALLKKDEKGINFDSTYSDTDIDWSQQSSIWKLVDISVVNSWHTGSKCEDLFGYLPHKIENRFIE